MNRPDSLEPRLYAKLKEKYSDLDIVRSDVLLKADKSLKMRVEEFVKGLKPNHDARLEDTRKFYEDYLDAAIEKLDKKGAHIDLSTLAMATSRTCETLFGHSGRIVEADQHYHIQEKRRKSILTRPFASIINRLFYNRDKKKAEFRSEYEVFMHVMHDGNFDQQIEKSKEHIEHVRTYFHNVINTLTDSSEDQKQRSTPTEKPDSAEMDKKIEEFYKKLDSEQAGEAGA